MSILDPPFRSSYSEADVNHLFYKIDAPLTSSASHGDGKVSKAEFVKGAMSFRRSRPCDLFDETYATHGGNLHIGGRCVRWRDGRIAEHWGPTEDDGEHGFAVAVSDIPCTEKDGCPSWEGVNPPATLCEVRFTKKSGASTPELIDCRGASGKFVQIVLPGDSSRIFPSAAKVKVHRASLPVTGGTEPTNPTLPTVCYGVQPRSVPSADNPNLLSETKQHPKQIVADNPEDPIFWSTCYERVQVRLVSGGLNKHSLSHNYNI